MADTSELPEPQGPQDLQQSQGLRIERIEVRDVRNLETVNLDLAATTNVFFGDNGQGKTSILEAIYWVATTKSFRTSRLREMIRHTTQGCSAQAWVRDRTARRHQQVGLTPTKRVVWQDGKTPAKTAKYAVKTPIVVFHPGELTLTMGPASARRTLIDRISLFVDPDSYDCHLAYKTAMKSRQQLLRLQGINAKGLHAYESLMVQYASRLAQYRQSVVQRLEQALIPIFLSLAPAETKLGLRYAPSSVGAGEQGMEQLFVARKADAARGSASVGPHRDDWILLLNDRSIRTDGSQGQHRLLTLCLKLAEMVCIEQTSGVRPLLLLDDVSSELDVHRTKAFFDFVGQRRDQVFLTTTRPQMLPVYEQTMGVENLWKVHQGTVRPG